MKTWRKIIFPSIYINDNFSDSMFQHLWKQTFWRFLTHRKHRCNRTYCTSHGKSREFMLKYSLKVLKVTYHAKGITDQIRGKYASFRNSCLARKAAISIVTFACYQAAKVRQKLEVQFFSLTANLCWNLPWGPIYMVLDTRYNPPPELPWAS